MKAIDEVILIQKFYFTAYSKIVELNNNYLKNILFISYGDYVKFEGIKPSVLINSSRATIDTLTYFLINSRPNLRDYFGPEYGSRLETIIFQDACSHFFDKFPWKSLHTDMCNEIPAARKGLVAFFSYEKDMLDNLASEMLKFPQAIADSENAIGLSPVITQYSSVEFLRYMRVHQAIMENTVELLFNSIDDAITEKLRSIEGELNQIGLGFFIPMAVFIILSSIAIHLIFSIDLEVSLMVFKNLLPEYLLHNPMIRTKFRDFYVKTF